MPALTLPCPELQISPSTQYRFQHSPAHNGSSYPHTTPYQLQLSPASRCRSSAIPYRDRYFPAQNCRSPLLLNTGSSTPLPIIAVPTPIPLHTSYSSPLPRDVGPLPPHTGTNTPLPRIADLPFYSMPVPALPCPQLQFLPPHASYRSPQPPD
ncbi:hypothetical protein SK128_008364, partial [Halocaridina rubra]